MRSLNTLLHYVAALRGFGALFSRVAAMRCCVGSFNALLHCVTSEWFLSNRDL